MKFVTIWLGYEDTGDESEWIPILELTHATNLVSDFHITYPAKPSPLPLSWSVICKSTHLEITSSWWYHLPIIQVCLPQWPPFLQHTLWRCCNPPGILSSTVGILLFNLVFHDGVTPVSVSTLKPLLGVTGVLLMKPWVSPILSVCI